MSSPHGSHWIQPERREFLYARDKYTCVYCGSNLRHTPRDQRTLDHILPRSQYQSLAMDPRGLHANRNLVTCCTDCNSKRQDTPIREFVQAHCGLTAQAVIEYILRIRREA